MNWDETKKIYPSDFFPSWEPTIDHRPDSFDNLNQNKNSLNTTCSDRFQDNSSNIGEYIVNWKLLHKWILPMQKDMKQKISFESTQLKYILIILNYWMIGIPGQTLRLHELKIQGEEVTSYFPHNSLVHSFMIYWSFIKKFFVLFFKEVLIIASSMTNPTHV